MAWSHNNWKNASFNPYKKDNRLLQGTVTAVRQQKEDRLENNEKKADHMQMQMDLGDVLSRPPEARVKWMQKALQSLSSKGNNQISAFYDIVLHRKFVSGISVELARQILNLLTANLHIFSIKQKTILEPKLLMLGAYLDATSEEDSGSEQEDDIALANAQNRSRSQSLASHARKRSPELAPESIEPRTETTAGSNNITNVANAAAVNAVNVAKASAAAARGSAAAAAAVPAALAITNSMVVTAEDAFTAAATLSASPSRAKPTKVERKCVKRLSCSRSKSKAAKKNEAKKTKRKKKKPKEQAKKESRSDKKRKRSSSGKRERKGSSSPSRSKKKKHKRKNSRSKSKKTKRKKASESSSSNKTRSRSKSKRCKKSSSSDSSVAKEKNFQGKDRRISPKRSADSSCIWLPPRESAKEAVAVSTDAKEEAESAARKMAMSGMSGHQVSSVNPQMRPGDWLCPICGAHNFSSKSQCFRCAKQPSHLASVPNAIISMATGAAQTMPGFSFGAATPNCGQDSLQTAQLNAARRLSAVPSPAALVRSGDWFCPVCSAHNFASKSKCFRCMKGMNPRVGGVRM